MSIEDYLKLKNSQILDFMNDDIAKALINKFFGFEFSGIELIKEVGIDITPKGDKHLRLGYQDREPLYASTDWNYIRFNVCGWQYEMVNGELMMYID